MSDTRARSDAGSPSSPAGAGSRPSYAHGTSTTPLIGETIGANLERAVAAHGDREALVVRHQGVRLSYAELNAQVDRVARALVAAGLQRGDRMGIWSPNCTEWVLVQYASAKAGVILVNVNPAYRTSELEYVLNQSGCRLLVAARAFKASDYVAMVEEVRPRCRQLERVVILDTSDWDELRAQGDVELDLPDDLQFDDPINVQYTSGTTGFPKGATLSHHNILNNGFFVGEACGYTPADRISIPVPFYHCFGMVMGNVGRHHAWRLHGRAGPFLRSGGNARGGAGGPLHLAVRRADDVHRRAGRARRARLRPLQPAHRNHGRLAMPGRGHAPGDRPCRCAR